MGNEHEMEKPTLGTHVHYVVVVVGGGGRKPVCRHAVVITVDKADPGLVIFNPQTAVFKHGVKEDESKKAGTYHAVDRCEGEPAEFEASPSV